MCSCLLFFFFFSSRRRHTRCSRDWSSDVCSSDLQRQRADEMTARLALGLRARLDQSRKRFAVAHLRIVSFDFRVKIAAFRLRLERGAADLGIRAERLLRSKRERLARLALQLEERSPLRVLERSEEHTSELQSRLHLVCRL